MNMLKNTNMAAITSNKRGWISHAEKKIDELVYELYGLSEEEVGIIEGI